MATNGGSTRKGQKLTGMFVTITACIFVASCLHSLLSPGEKRQSNVRTGTQLAGVVTKSAASNATRCTYQPRDQEDCIFALTNRIPPTKHNHWGFFGDSHMSHLFRDRSAIFTEHYEAVQKKCSCQASQSTDRCNQHAAYGFKKRDPWEKSNTNLEGPVGYGRETDGCTDLSGHIHRLLQCDVSCSEPFASYHLVEFARDVELQTPESRYTQENVMSYLRRETESLGKMTCAVGTLYHDVKLGGGDEAVYLANVRWYLGLLLRGPCSHVVWIGAPARSQEVGVPQSIDLLKKWNGGVEDILRSTEFRAFTTFVDQLEATRGWPHRDAVHLDETYSKHLGELFSKVMATKRDESSNGKGVVSSESQSFT
uniref:Uncharacterized protein n=1 Tax=Odontella aurita TaxID=265563 RepID=A0A7S4HKV8_9STRA|mmetsp:Transcript_11629/g.34190  ORF Transcript_11629/g.34190 Transcript_11629/m.34190 type:complete len:368 (+) Transcript_11629:104-1207(+)